MAAVLPNLSYLGMGQQMAAMSVGGGKTKAGKQGKGGGSVGGGGGGGGGSSVQAGFKQNQQGHQKQNQGAAGAGGAGTGQETPVPYLQHRELLRVTGKPPTAQLPGCGRSDHHQRAVEVGRRSRARSSSTAAKLRHLGKRGLETK